VQNLLALWTAQDPEAAGHWLRGLPGGSLQDAGIAAYTEALADLDRTSGMEAHAGGPSRRRVHVHPDKAGGSLEQTIQLNLRWGKIARRFKEHGHELW
jgi:hypothetical protein